VKVFWHFLAERAILDPVHRAMRDVAIVCDREGYEFIDTTPRPKDVALNFGVKFFLEQSSDPEDRYVCLDADHLHPPDVVKQLAEAKFAGALAGLARARCDASVEFTHQTENDDDLTLIGQSDMHHKWLIWKRDADGKMQLIKDFKRGEVVPCDAFGVPALCIPRWVFGKLDECGAVWPHFREEYEGRVEGKRAIAMIREDDYFCATMRYASVPMAVHTGVWCPHFIWGWV
jgi:hypothetical protein